MQTAELKSLIDQLWTTHADAIINFIAVLCGAFFGAMIAFWLQLKAQRNQETRDSIMASHKILFCLLQQFNTMTLINRDLINPYIDNPGRHIQIPATTPYNTEKNIFDFKAINYMLETHESRRILFDMHIAQENYLETLVAFNERSKMHNNEVQPRLAKIENNGTKGITIEQSDAALGFYINESIRNSTNSCIEIQKRTSKLLLESKTAFRNYAMEKFKSNNFTDFDI